jgi:hypothetical protein
MSDSETGMQPGDYFVDRVDPVIRSDGDFVGTGEIWIKPADHRDDEPQSPVQPGPVPVPAAVRFRGDWMCLLQDAAAGGPLPSPLRDRVQRKWPDHGEHRDVALRSATGRRAGWWWTRP